MSTPTLPHPQRKVVLRLPGGAKSALDGASSHDVQHLLAQAHALGLPLHHDPQVAALLVSLKMSGEVPPLLYAAAAAVLATIYDTAQSAAPALPPPTRGDDDDILLDMDV